MFSATESLISWLTANGYAASSYPPESGSEFVTVERTGGGVADMVDHPTMAVQTWAATEVRAEEMAIAIRDAILTMAGPDGFASLRVNSGPYPFWDEYTRMPRYQTVYDCTAIIHE